MDKWSIKSRELLKKPGVDIDDARNGAKLPGWFHRTGNFLHSNKGTKWVYDRLAAAAEEGAEAVEKEFEQIRKILERHAKQAKKMKCRESADRLCR